MSTLVVVYELEGNGRKIVSDALDGAAEVVYLPDLDDAGRADALRNADAVLARTTRELRQGEIALLKDTRLVQFINAGIDFVPLAELPAGVQVATNGGAYAEPMAEHALAMALAAAKRLLVEHAALASGEFNQFTRNRMLAGGVCGILGFGGIGVATARLARGIGMKVHAINRRGRSEEPTDWIGTPDQLDMLLAASDVLVICTPLTPATQGHDRRAAACAHEGGRDPGECRARRDRRRARAVSAAGGVSEVQRVHRCVVDRAGPPRHVPHGSAVHVAAQCDRLAAQLGGGDRGNRRRGLQRAIANIRRALAGRDAALSGAAGRSDDVAAFVITE